MNTKEFKHMLVKMFSQDESLTSVAVFGPPGNGKTSIVGQAAHEVGKDLITIALPTCEAVDLRGLPQVKDGRTVWASPLPKKGQGVLLLDEVSSAAPDVQVAAHHLVWREKGSDIGVPPGWHIVLTGNRAQDKTLYRAMSGPLRNRLLLISLEPEPRQWCEWAMEAGVDPTVVGFIRWRPEMLTAKEIPGEGAFPSPRAWERASRMTALSFDIGVEREILRGIIGEGAEVEYSAYLRMVRELPSIEAILADPKKSAIPTSPSLMYALVTSLSQYTRSTQTSAMEYILRFPAEFGLLYIRDIRDYYKEFRTDPNVREWVRQHKRLFKDEQ